MKTIFVFNGPNLNLLGTREPAVYGSQTLADVEKLCADACAVHGFKLDFRQTNHEGMLVDWLQEAGRAQAAGTAAGVVTTTGARPAPESTSTAVSAAWAVPASDRAAPSGEEIGAATTASTSISTNTPLKARISRLRMRRFSSGASRISKVGRRSAMDIRELRYQGPGRQGPVGGRSS